jgi:valyl-tRNA synthetase
LANINSISYNEAKPEKCLSALAGKDELFIPFEEAIDEAAEQKKVEEEIAYLKGFLKSVDAKLSNEKFVSNAKPDVIEKERQKKADAEEKIKKLGGA